MVQDRRGRAVQSIHVAIIGQGGTISDSNGRFAFSEVAPSYDLAVVDQGLSGTKRVLVFHRLTRRDPHIRLPGGGPYVDDNRTADVAIRVQLAVPYAKGPGEGLEALVVDQSGAGSSGGVSLETDTTGRVDSTMHWIGGSTTDVTAMVVHLAHAIDTPGAYLGLGRAAVTLTDGQPASATLTLAAVDDGLVTGMVVGDDTGTWSAALHPTGTHFFQGFGGSGGPTLPVDALDLADFDLYGVWITAGAPGSPCHREDPRLDRSRSCRRSRAYSRHLLPALQLHPSAAGWAGSRERRPRASTPRPWPSPLRARGQPRTTTITGRARDVRRDR